MTAHTRQLQQYTRSTKNNYTKDNLNLATKHTRQIKLRSTRKWNKWKSHENIEKAQLWLSFVKQVNRGNKTGWIIGINRKEFNENVKS